MSENILTGYVDLHVHSNHSDGTYSVEELVAYAKEKGLYAIALTDHDTVSGISEAVNVAKRFGIMLIPGIEMSSDYNGVDLHILGLNIDYKNEEFNEFLVQCRENRNNRNIRMAEKLQALGIVVTYDSMKELYKESTITRAHFARYLQDNGYVKSKQEAFDRYLKKGAKAYVPKTTISPKQAIDIIKVAGGHPVLAHPLLYKFGKAQLDSLFDYLKGLGLEGIEGLYSLNTKSDDERLLKMAKSHRLYITGGSDFHGANKPDIDLGVGKGSLRVPKDILKNIL